MNRREYNLAKCVTGILRMWEQDMVAFCMLRNGIKSMSNVRAKKQCVQLSVVQPCSLETHTTLMTVHFSLFTQPFLHLQVQSPSHSFLALERYPVPLVPGTGHGDMPQHGRHSLNGEVNLIHM